MKELNALKSTVNQPRLAIQNSETKKIFVEKVQHRRSRNGEQLFPQPATPLSLSRKQGRRKFAGFSLKPNASFPIRVLIVLLNVAGERVAVMVQQRILQPCGPAAHNDMLVHFHVTHRAVLVLEAAFESALPAAKERQLAETCIAVGERGRLRASLRTGMMTLIGRVTVESVGRSGLGSASVRIPMGDRRQHLNVNEGVHKYARGYLLCADAVLLSGSNPLQKWQARRVRNSKTKFGTFGTRSRAVRGIWKALRTSRPLMRTRVLATRWNPTYHSLPNFP